LAIDKVEFEKAKPAPAVYNRILEFLTKNINKAYSEGEIIDEMLRDDMVLKRMTTVGIQAFVLTTLDNLVADGKVTARIPGMSTYYMAVQVSAEPSNKEEHGPDVT